jgi:transposase
MTDPEGSMSTRTLKGMNRNGWEAKDSTPLRDFFHRINFKKGRVSAISATARKLAVIVWNMVTKGTRYINPEGYLFLDQKRKLGLVKRIQKQIDKFGLTNQDIQFTTN